MEQRRESNSLDTTQQQQQQDNSNPIFITTHFTKFPKQDDDIVEKTEIKKSSPTFHFQLPSVSLSNNTQIVENASQPQDINSPNQTSKIPTSDTQWNRQCFGNPDSSINFTTPAPQTSTLYTNNDTTIQHFENKDNTTTTTNEIGFNTDNINTLNPNVSQDNTMYASTLDNQQDIFSPTRMQSESTTLPHKDNTLFYPNDTILQKSVEKTTPHNDFNRHRNPYSKSSKRYIPPPPPIRRDVYRVGRNKIPPSIPPSRPTKPETRQRRQQPPPPTPIKHNIFLALPLHLDSVGQWLCSKSSKTYVSAVILFVGILVTAWFIVRIRKKILYQRLKREKSHRNHAIEQQFHTTPKFETIFISLPCFGSEDVERCIETLDSIFRYSQCPQRVFVGICQHLDGGELERRGHCKTQYERYCASIGHPSPFHDHIRIRTEPSRNAQGPNHARYLIHAHLYQGEQFYLLLKPGCLLTPGWDKWTVLQWSKAMIQSREPVKYNTRLNETVSSTESSPSTSQDSTKNTKIPILTEPALGSVSYRYANINVNPVHDYKAQQLRDRFKMSNRKIKQHYRVHCDHNKTVLFQKDNLRKPDIVETQHNLNDERDGYTKRRGFFSGLFGGKREHQDKGNHHTLRNSSHFGQFFPTTYTIEEEEEEEEEEQQQQQQSPSPPLNFNTKLSNHSMDRREENQDTNKTNVSSITQPQTQWRHHSKHDSRESKIAKKNEIPNIKTSTLLQQDTNTTNTLYYEQYRHVAKEKLYQDRREKPYFTTCTVWQTQHDTPFPIPMLHEMEKFPSLLPHDWFCFTDFCFFHASSIFDTTRNTDIQFHDNVMASESVMFTSSSSTTTTTPSPQKLSNILRDDIEVDNDINSKSFQFDPFLNCEGRQNEWLLTLRLFTFGCVFYRPQFRILYDRLRKQSRTYTNYTTKHNVWRKNVSLPLEMKDGSDGSNEHDIFQESMSMSSMYDMDSSISSDGDAIVSEDNVGKQNDSAHQNNNNQHRRRRLAVHPTIGTQDPNVLRYRILTRNDINVSHYHRHIITHQLETFGMGSVCTLDSFQTQFGIYWPLETASREQYGDDSTEYTYRTYDITMFARLGLPSQASPQEILEKYGTWQSFYYFYAIVKQTPILQQQQQQHIDTHNNISTRVFNTSQRGQQQHRDSKKNNRKHHTSKQRVSALGYEYTI